MNDTTILSYPEILEALGRAEKATPGPENVSAGCMGMCTDIPALCRTALAAIEREEKLKEAIWPGLPNWVPTPEHPQQDFYLALIESWRTQHALDTGEIKELTTEREEAADTLKALREAFEKAPHSYNCFSARRRQDNTTRFLHGLEPLPDGECDCRKAELMKAVQRG